MIFCQIIFPLKFYLFFKYSIEQMPFFLLFFSSNSSFFKPTIAYVPKRNTTNRAGSSNQITNHLYGTTNCAHSGYTVFLNPDHTMFSFICFCGIFKGQFLTRKQRRKILNILKIIFLIQKNV